MLGERKCPLRRHAPHLIRKLKCHRVTDDTHTHIRHKFSFIILLTISFVGNYTQIEKYSIRTCFQAANIIILIIPITDVYVCIENCFHSIQLRVTDLTKAAQNNTIRIKLSKRGSFVTAHLRNRSQSFCTIS